MTDLAYVLDVITRIDSHISLNDLSADEIDSLRDRVIWAYSDPRSGQVRYVFGDKLFSPQGARKGVIISTGSKQFDYELKAIMLLLFHHGLREGGVSYKWHTVAQRVRTLVKFSEYCAKAGLASFRDFPALQTLRVRNLLLAFLTGNDRRSGMNAQLATSCYKSFRDAFKHLVDYGLIPCPVMELLNELTLAEIDRHEVRNRLRHAIIPTGIMKQLIAEASSYLENAENRFEDFSKAFRQTHHAIIKGNCKTLKHIISSAEYDLVKQLKETLYSYFRDLKRHTYTLILAFTGMRDAEVGALKTGSAHSRIEDGEQFYYLNSVMTKTADNAIQLDWIANELIYRAVTLLSKVNALYYERARLILEHQSHRLTETTRNKLTSGLKNQWLFGLRLTVCTSDFVVCTKGGDCVKSLRLGLYRILVTEQDLQQLETMACNYRSVAANSGNRGVPYRVGDVFKFTAHQFRHTFAWFIIANRLGDLDDIKYQFKHLHRAMSLVYAERGFQSFNELRAVIEHFGNLLNKRSLDDIVQAAETGIVAGGGGERLTRMLQALNSTEEEMIFGTDIQPHFHEIKDIIKFMTRHSDSIRGLPHGYCIKGPSCKIKNIADPSHCLYCDTYFTTPKHLPYWKAIKSNCESKLARISAMPDHTQQQFQVFKQSLEDNLFAANKIICRLLPDDMTTKRAT